MTLIATDHGRLAAPSRQLIQGIIAEGSPILALGPGCQRIGYDDSLAWDEVTARARILSRKVTPVLTRSTASHDDDLISGDIPSSDEGTDDADLDEENARILGVALRRHVAFLEAFWRTKLADETQRRFTGKLLPDELRLDAPTGDRGDRELLDAVRTDMAARLLCCLSESTRCLALVIAEGAAPVTSWADVSYHGQEGTDVETAHGLAGMHLTHFVKMTDALSGYGPGEGQSDDAGPMLEDWGIHVEPGAVQDERITEFVDLLKLDAVHHHVAGLLASCFTGARSRPLSGAMLEWLSDLLWHILASDSRVPASQSELAFFVNLRATGDLSRRRDFTRAAPGDYHGAGENELYLDVLRLHSTHDNGLNDDEPLWKRDDRALFLRTMAATLRAMWRRSEDRRSQLKGLSAPEAAHRQLPPVISLVSAYDLMLERQLWEILDPGESFHVVVPAWHSSRGGRRLVWLWGTIVKPSRGHRFEPKYLIGHDDVGKPTIKWRWWAHSAEERFEPTGPVLIKVNGAPLMSLGDGVVTPRDIGLDERSRGALRLAMIYAEHDALSTIIGEADDVRMLPPQLASTLSWESRNWLFFGDRFPDWIPRLRLAQHARARRGSDVTRAGEEDEASEIQRIAVDRAFDWPELALLEALSIDAHQGDLRGLIDYAATRYPGHESMERFLVDVTSRLPHVSERQT